MAVFSTEIMQKRGEYNIIKILIEKRNLSTKNSLLRKKIIVKNKHEIDVFLAIQKIYHY